MFKPSTSARAKAKNEAAEDILDLFVQIKPGEDIGHDEVKKAIQRHIRDCERDEYYQIVHRAKRLLFRGSGIRMVTKFRTGYRKPTGMEQVHEGIRTMKHGAKRATVGAKILQQIDDKRFDTPQELEARNYILGQFDRVALLAREEARKCALLVGTPRPLPQPKLESLPPARQAWKR